MFVYIYLWLILLLCSTIYSKWNVLYATIYYLIFCFFLIIAGGRMVDVGVDTHTYQSIFDSIKENGYLLYIEPGWNVLNILSSTCFFSFNGLLTLVSLCTLFPVFYVVKKESFNPFLSLFIYYSMHIYCASFNIMRQYLAVSWILLMYYYLFRGRKLLAFIAFLVAMSFHYSSLLILLVVFVVKFIKIDKSNNIIIYLMIALFIGTVMNDSFFSIFAFKYDSYVSNGLYRDSSKTALLLASLVSTFVFILVKTIKDEYINNYWVKLFFLSAVVLNITYRLEYGARIYVLLSVSQLLAFPMYLKYNIFKNKKIVFLFLNIYLSVLFFRMLLSNANDICPYKNIWLN